MPNRSKLIWPALLLGLFSGGPAATQENQVNWSLVRSELAVEYVSRYLFRGTDVFEDDPALQASYEALFPYVLQPGDLIVGFWMAGRVEGGLFNSERDELRGYFRMENESADGRFHFMTGMTFYDIKGDAGFFDNGEDLDFYETWIGVKLLELPFQPDFRVYYDHPLDGTDPEKGVYAGLTLEHQQPTGKIGAPLGLRVLDFRLTGWYQDGVFGFEPGGSIEAGVEAPFQFWNIELRPGIHISHLFSDPKGSGISDDEDEWWFTAAAVYRFGGPKPLPEEFSTGPEQFLHGLEMPK